MATIINASTSSGLVETGDTSGTLTLQGNGVTGITIDSTGAYGQLKQGTAQASTSGTSIDFTSIPSWVKRITIMVDQLSTSGTSIKLVRFGTASGVEITGYRSVGTTFSTSASVSSARTDGYEIGGVNAADILNGQIVLCNLSGNTWTVSGSFAFSSGTAASICSGSKTLAATLDRVRITTVNGTDTFDAGSINILYEG